MKKFISILLVAIMCLSLIPVSLAAEMKFADVKSSDWFYEDVKEAVDLGLVNGKTATKYAPNDKLTYSEVIKLAACMNQLYKNGSVTLKNGNPWYQSYVDYCKKNKIISKDYNYTQNVTRAGYMEIFAKALPDEALPAINNVPSNSIPDVQMSSYYAEDVYKLYRAGILAGVNEEHYCNPYANITRAEVAAILTRMMNETKRVKFNMGEEEPEVTDPEVTDPEVTDPEVTDPEVTDPEVTDPEATEPEATEPEAKALAIAIQPEATSLNVGETAILTIVAEGGKAPYTYQWRNTVTVSKTVTTDLEDNSTISGATTDTLIMTATAGTTYKVSCKITDADGNSVTSETVTVQFTAESSGGAKDKFEQVDTEELKNEDFAFTIDGVYNVASRGIVLTGYVSAGKVNVGDTVYLNDADGKYVATTTVKAIEMFKKLFDEAEKGDKPGINVDLDVDTYKVVDLTGYVLSATKRTTSSLGSRPTASRPSTTTRPTVSLTLEISTQPQNAAVLVGKTATFTVAVKGGKAPYTYQWQTYRTSSRSWVNLINNTAVTGATAAELILKPAAAGNTQIRCVITDANGDTVTSTTVTVVAK